MDRKKKSPAPRYQLHVNTGRTFTDFFQNRWANKLVELSGMIQWAIDDGFTGHVLDTRTGKHTSLDDALVIVRGINALV